jgi:membrane protease YdiL (CAAX protease family)
MKSLKRAFGIISPIVIFLLIQYLITLSATFIFMNQAVDVESSLDQEALSELYNAAYEMLNDNVVLISGIAAVISIPIFYRMLNREWLKRAYRYQETVSTPIKYVYVVLAAVGMNVAFNLAVNAFEFFRYAVDYARIARGIYSEPLILQILVIGFLMPISEELMFRGLIFERLSFYGNVKMAAILTSVIFGFYHGTVIQIGYAFVFSLMMIYAYNRCGSFLAPLLFHIACNLSSLALNQLSPLSSMGYSIGIVLSFMVGLFGLYRLKQGDFCQKIWIHND